MKEPEWTDALIEELGSYGVVFTHSMYEMRDEYVEWTKALQARIAELEEQLEPLRKIAAFAVHHD